MFQFAFDGALFTLNAKAPPMPEALFALAPAIRRSAKAAGALRITLYWVKKVYLSERCLSGEDSPDTPSRGYAAAGCSQDRPQPMFQCAYDGAPPTANAKAPPRPEASVAQAPANR